MPKILVVDDEPAIVSMLSMHLRFAGYTCLPAADAAEARRILQTDTPDVALLDVMLPGEDGFALCSVFTARKIPVIFLTAKTAVQDRVYGLRLGAEDYILKPFEPAELLARIEVILRRAAGIGGYNDEKTIDCDRALPAAWQRGKRRYHAGIYTVSGGDQHRCAVGDDVRGPGGGRPAG